VIECPAAGGRWGLLSSSHSSRKGGKSQATGRTPPPPPLVHARSREGNISATSSCTSNELQCTCTLLCIAIAQLAVHAKNRNILHLHNLYSVYCTSPASKISFFRTIFVALDARIKLKVTGRLFESAERLFRVLPSLQDTVLHCTAASSVRLLSSRAKTKKPKNQNSTSSERIPDRRLHISLSILYSSFIRRRHCWWSRLLHGLRYRYNCGPAPARNDFIS